MTEYGQRAYRGEARNFVAEPLGGNDGDLIDDALVDVKVLGQATIVLLDDDAGRLLDGLGAHATLRGTAHSQCSVVGCGQATCYVIHGANCPRCDNASVAADRPAGSAGAPGLSADRGGQGAHHFGWLSDSSNDTG